MPSTDHSPLIELAKPRYDAELGEDNALSFLEETPPDTWKEAMRMLKLAYPVVGSWRWWC